MPEQDECILKAPSPDRVRWCERETMVSFRSFSASARPPPIQHVYDQNSSGRTFAKHLELKKHPLVSAGIAVFSRRQAGVNQSLQRTDRQWLHSNLWGGSVTVLFLAPLSRVSVSLRKLSVARPDDWTAAVSPACPRRGVFSSLVPLMSLSPAAGRGGGGPLLSSGVIDRSNPLLCFCFPTVQYVSLLLSNYRRGPFQAGRLELELGQITAAALLLHSCKKKTKTKQKKKGSTT